MNENHKNIEANVDEIETVVGQRNLKGIIGIIFMAIMVFTSLIHIIILNFFAVEPWLFRLMHVTLGTIVGFALYPGWKTKKANRIHIIDWLLIFASIAIFIYIYVNFDQLMFRAGVLPTTWDFIVALAGTLLVIELTRRTSGWSLPILAIIFILYAFLGPYLPGIFEHGGYSIQRFFSYIYGLDGIFGVTTDVSSKYILLFIVFGAFLQASKVGNFFVDFSFSLAGGMRGGPAKVALFSSALMGMISGTSAGNAVATGSLTIPLMKRVGYRGRFAAATEATASSGGQIMPPIMGAGAFIMAEIIGIPYQNIMIAAVIPAILYFVSVYFMIDKEAIKNRLVGLKRSELPKMKVIMRRGYLFIPVIVLIISLVSGFSIIRSGTYGILSCFIVSWISKQTRMGLSSLIEALANGTRNMIQLLAVCACAGIIVGVISLTGIGMRFSSMLLGIADNSLLLALIFAMILSIILGMGMPTTAAYAVAASVVAPGLVRLGLDPLFAHMFIFYYAAMSAITPPVALAAYAAAGIAGTDPMKTGLEAFKLGIAAFIVPFMFVYSPTLLAFGTWYEIALTIVTSTIGIFLLASSVQGWYFGKANLIQRIILFVASLVLIHASIETDIIGLVLAAIAFIIGKIVNKDRAPKQPVQA